MWFGPKVDKMYVASQRLFKRAMKRGRAPKEKIVLTGLPIRHAFAEEAERLKDRTTEEGKAYQRKVRQDLNIDTDKPMVLVMGGGEGVGGLSSIVNQLYSSLVKKGIDATIYVVCGRNEKLRAQLAEKDWDQVVAGHKTIKQRKRLLGIFPRKSKGNDMVDDAGQSTSPGDVDVVGLGFITRMAEYMVAADILVTKAGPGTIAEAASLGLPCMLTSFLPGQEAGNVDVVVDSGFGHYCKDPVAIGEKLADWLRDDELLKSMSCNAREAGRPNAATDIVLDIGRASNTWKVLNGEEKSMSSVKW